jgi:predicted nucleic acid-binding protein
MTVGSGRRWGDLPPSCGSVDLPIAATALAGDLPLYTRNPDDPTAPDGLVDLVAVPLSSR